MATETIESFTIGSEGMTVSLLVWRRFRRPMAGLVERIYSINPALARQGPFLEVGTVVKVPIPAEKGEPEVTPVRLWG